MWAHVAVLCIAVLAPLVHGEILVPTPLMEARGDAESPWNAAVYLEPSKTPRQLYIFTNGQAETVQRNFLSGRPDPAKVTLVTPEDAALSPDGARFVFARPSLVEDPKWLAGPLAEQREWKKKGVSTELVPRLPSSAIAFFIDRSAPGFSDEALQRLPIPPTQQQQLKAVDGGDVAICFEEILRAGKEGDKRFLFIVVSAPNEDWLAESLRRLRVVKASRSAGKWPIVSTASRSFPVRELLAVTWPTERRFVEDYGRHYGRPRPPESHVGCDIDFEQIPLEEAQEEDIKNVAGADVLLMVVRGEQWGKPSDDAVKRMRALLPDAGWHTSFLAQRKHQTLQCKLERPDGSHFILISAPTERSLATCMPTFGAEGMHLEPQIDLRGVTRCSVLTGEPNSNTAAGVHVAGQLGLRAASEFGRRCPQASAAVVGTVGLTSSGAPAPEEIARVVGPGVTNHLIAVVSLDAYNATHQVEWDQNKITPDPPDPPPLVPENPGGDKPLLDWASSLNRYISSYGVPTSTRASKENVYAVYSTCRSWQSQKAQELRSQADNGTYVWETWLAHAHALSCSGAVQVVDPSSGVPIWRRPFSVQLRTQGPSTHQAQKTVRGMYAVPPLGPVPDNSQQAQPDALVDAVVSRALQDTLDPLFRSALLPDDGGTWELPAPAAPDQALLAQVDHEVGELVARVGGQFPTDRKVLWMVNRRGEDGALELVTLAKVTRFSESEDGLMAWCRPAFTGFDVSQLVPGMVMTASGSEDPDFPPVPGRTTPPPPATSSPFLPLRFSEDAGSHWVETKGGLWEEGISRGDRIAVSMVRQCFTADGQPVGLPELSPVAVGTVGLPNGTDGHWVILDGDLPAPAGLPAPLLGIPALVCDAPASADQLAQRVAARKRLADNGYTEEAAAGLSERVCSKDWLGTPLPQVFVPRLFPGPDRAALVGPLAGAPTALKAVRLQDGTAIDAQGTAWQGRVTKGMGFALARTAYWVDAAGQPTGERHTEIIAIGARGLPNGNAAWWADFGFGEVPDDLAQTVALPVVVVPSASQTESDTDAALAQLLGKLQQAGLAPDQAEQFARKAVTVSLISTQDGAAKAFLVAVLPEPQAEPHQ